MKRFFTNSFFAVLVGAQLLSVLAMEIVPCFKLDSLPDELVSSYILGNIAISAFDGSNTSDALRESITSIFNFDQTCKRYNRIVRDTAVWETILFPQLDKSHPKGMPALCGIAWCLPDGHWLIPSLTKYVQKQLLVEGEQSPQLDAQKLKMRLPWADRFLKYPASSHIDVVNAPQLELLAMADCLSPHQAEKVLSGIMRVCKRQYDNFYPGFDEHQYMALTFLRRFLGVCRNSPENTATMKRLLDHSVTILDEKFTIADDKEADLLAANMSVEILNQVPDLEKIRSIIENPFFDINRKGQIPDINGVALLFVAVCHAKTHVLQLLLAYGADSLKLWEDQDSALTLACQLPDCQTVEMLIKEGFDPCMRVGRYHRSPLETAVFKERIEIIKVLLAAGVDPNDVFEDANGIIKKSSLAMAVKTGNKTIVALLLQHGADPNVATIEGTPLEIAQSKGYQHIVELIEEHVRKLS